MNLIGQAIPGIDRYLPFQLLHKDINEGKSEGPVTREPETFTGAAAVVRVNERISAVGFFIQFNIDMTLPVPGKGVFR